MADRLLKWMVTNELTATAFATSIVKDIRDCCSHPKSMVCHTFKEQMWEKFYKLSSSERFRMSWTEFLQTSIGFNACPIFYQFITKTILEGIIKTQFPVISSPSHCVVSLKTQLDFEECNALRYCGGYLLRSLKKKISKSAHPLKSSLLLSLEDLFEAGQLTDFLCLCDLFTLIIIGRIEPDDSEEPDESESARWTQAINRGGLVTIDDIMYQFLVSMEMEFRSHFTVTNATTIDESMKDLAFQGIMQSEDVLFYWAIISVNWDLTEANELLQIIVKHYITVRGFSFASAFMEKYKQQMKKSTEKSKGIRKTLH